MTRKFTLEETGSRIQGLRDGSAVFAVVVVGNLSVGTEGARSRGNPDWADQFFEERR